MPSEAFDHGNAAAWSSAEGNNQFFSTFPVGEVPEIDRKGSIVSFLVAIALPRLAFGEDAVQDRTRQQLSTPQ
jgi:hypothetical protein